MSLLDIVLNVLGIRPRKWFVIPFATFLAVGLVVSIVERSWATCGVATVGILVIASQQLSGK